MKMRGILRKGEARVRPRSPRIWIGLAISLPIHAILIAILARIEVRVGTGSETPGPMVEVAVVNEQPLEQAQTSPSSPSPEIAPAESLGETPDAGSIDLPDLLGNSEADATAVIAAVPKLLASTGAVTLSGSGGGSSQGGPAGSGIGTSFFGVKARGRRIGYVVDKSGSMGTLTAGGNRFLTAAWELNRSVSMLPDYASVCIALYDGGLVTMDPKVGFIKCRREAVEKLKEWLRSISPAGTTDPVPAFKFLFSRDERPDSVFFMSDGEFPMEAAEQILRLNRRGPNTVIHCIAFGKDAATAPLRRVATETGGRFSIQKAGDL
jgi:hypothetical protein